MRIIAASLAILATTPFISQFGGCLPESVVTACHAEFRAAGPYVRADEVWDDLHVWCSPSPTSNAITARFDYRRFAAEYAPLGKSVYTPRIPDTAGFVVSPHTDCVSGWYRATANVTATNQAGQTSKVALDGVEREFTAVDCAK